MNSRHPFSSRLHWRMQPNPLSRLVDEKRRAGARVLDMTIANPTLLTGDTGDMRYPEDEIRAALTGSAIFRYVPDPRGLLQAREAIAEYYSTLGANVHPDDIFLTASTSEGYANLFKLLTDPGGEVLVPRPGYPLFDFVAGMELVELRQYNMRYSGLRWETDFLSLEAMASERTRAVIAIHPNNPTGNYQNAKEQARLREFCSSTGCALIVDEVFYEYPSPGFERPASFAAEESADFLTFTLNGFSKLLGLPQLKLGWITIHGPEAIKAEARHWLELIADTYLSVNTPVMQAAKPLLHVRERMLSQINARCNANMEFLRSVLPESMQVFEREGGWYGIIELPLGQGGEDWCLRLLKEADTYAHPGTMYDIPGDRSIVVSLVTPPGIFREGAGRIAGRTA